MTEYWLILLLVSLESALAWVFFRQLARLAIWSQRPILDACRSGLVSFCLAIDIGYVFEVWEATLLGALSLMAYRAILREMVHYEATMQELTAHVLMLSDERSKKRSLGA